MSQPPPPPPQRVTVNLGKKRPAATQGKPIAPPIPGAVAVAPAPPIPGAVAVAPAPQMPGAVAVAPAPQMPGAGVKRDRAGLAVQGAVAAPGAGVKRDRAGLAVQGAVAAPGPVPAMPPQMPPQMPRQMLVPKTALAPKSALADALKAKQNAVTLLPIPARSNPRTSLLQGMPGLSELRNPQDPDGFEVLATAFFHAGNRPCEGAVTVVETPRHLEVLSWNTMCFSTYTRSSDQVMLNLMRNDATLSEIISSLMRSISGYVNTYVKPHYDEVQKKLRPLTPLTQEIDALEASIRACEDEINACSSAIASASASASASTFKGKCGHCNKYVGHNITKCKEKKMSDLRYKLFQEQQKLQKLNEEKVKSEEFKKQWSDFHKMMQAKILEMTDLTRKKYKKMEESLKNPKVSIAQKIANALETLALNEHLCSLVSKEYADFFELFDPSSPSPSLPNSDPKIALEKKIEAMRRKNLASHGEKVITPKKFYPTCKTFAILDFSGHDDALKDARKVVTFKLNLMVNLRWSGQNFDAVVNVDLHELAQSSHVGMSEMVNLLMDAQFKERVADLMCQAHPVLDQAKIRILANGTPQDPDANWNAILFETGCSGLQIIEENKKLHLWSAPQLARQRFHVPIRGPVAVAGPMVPPPMSSVLQHTSVPRPMSETRKRRRVLRAKHLANVEDSYDEDDVRASVALMKSLVGEKGKNKTRKRASNVVVQTPTAFLSALDTTPKLYPLPPPRPNFIQMPSSIRYMQPIHPAQNVRRVVPLPGLPLRGFLQSERTPPLQANPAVVSDTESVLDPTEFRSYLHYQRLLKADKPRKTMKKVVRNESRGSLSERSSSEGSHTRARRPVSPAAAAPEILRASPVIASSPERPFSDSSASASSASASGLPARSSRDSLSSSSTGN